MHGASNMFCQRQGGCLQIVTVDAGSTAWRCWWLLLEAPYSNPRIISKHRLGTSHSKAMALQVVAASGPASR
jgi:hypothetical protein